MNLLILTFADLDTFAPRVIELCIAGLSTITVPSTSDGATTRIAEKIGTALRTHSSDTSVDG